MARQKVQELSVFAEDLNAFHLESTDTGAPFADLLLDGAYAGIFDESSEAFVGSGQDTYLGGTSAKVLDLDSSTFFIPLINFTTGVTGSTAVVTITGEDFTGGALTETVTMPGASGNISATKLFRIVRTMTIDGAYTNLQVGVRNEVDQFSKWLLFDTYANPFEVYLDLIEVTDGSTLTVELTSDVALQDSPVDANGIDAYDASTSPFAAGITASQDGKISADGPFIAARLRHTAGTAGKWRARFTQSGGGRGR